MQCLELVEDGVWEERKERRSVGTLRRLTRYREL